MGHYVMQGDRPVATELGDKYEGSGVFVPEVLAERARSKADVFCQFCSPPRPFSSDHAYRVHLGKTHPAEKARQAHSAAVKQRKEENAAREAAQ